MEPGSHQALPPPPPPPLPWHVLRGHAGAVHALAFVRLPAPAHVVLVSGDSEGCVQVWDLARRRPLAACPGAHAAHHGALALIGSDDGSASLLRCRDPAA